MEVSNHLVSWFITYLRDLLPTYIGVITQLLSTMDTLVLFRQFLATSGHPKSFFKLRPFQRPQNGHKVLTLRIWNDELPTETNLVSSFG